MGKRSARTPARPNPSSALDAPTTIEVSAGVFKDICLALMDEVREGRTEVVITKYGRAVARLVAPSTEGPNAFGFLRGTVLSQDDIVSPDADAWGELG